MPLTVKIFFSRTASLHAEEFITLPENAVIRPYNIADRRFCHITPSQFICEKCLEAGDEFIQILTFDKDGRPFRLYACRRGYHQKTADAEQTDE